MGHRNPVKCIYLFNILRKHFFKDVDAFFIITIQRTTSIGIQCANAASLLRTFAGDIDLQEYFDA